MQFREGYVMSRGIIKIQALFLVTALVVSAFFCVAEPVNAGETTLQAPILIKATKYKASKKMGVISLKWNKAYGKLSDGSIVSAKGYEIQYATNKKFKKAKTIVKGGNANAASINLKALNTKKKYKKKINKYYIRIRSFAVVDGVEVYSPWRNAKKKKGVTAYRNVKLQSIAANENTVTLEWKQVNLAEGYVIYGKKVGDSEWTKKRKIKDPAKVTFTEKDLDYTTDYVYKVLSFRKRIIKDPRKVLSTRLQALGNGVRAYEVTTPEPQKYTVEFYGNSETSGAMDSLIAYKNKTYSLPKSAFKKKGYKFVGWSLAPNDSINMESFQLGKVYLEDEAAITDLTSPGETIKLYACWKGSSPAAAADWGMRIIESGEFRYQYAKSKKGKFTSPPCFFCNPDSKYGKSYNCNRFVAHALHHGAGTDGWVGSCVQSYKGWEKNQGPFKVTRGVINEDTKLKKGDVIFTGKHVALLYSVSGDKYVTLEATGSRKWGPQKPLHTSTWTKEKFMKKYKKYLRYS